MDLKTMIYERKGHIVFLTLNRPERLNARNSVMLAELPEVWEEFKNDDDAWVMVLTGAGEKGFCAGVDVKEIAEAESKGGAAAHVSSSARSHLPIESRQHDVWKPIVVAVNGICCGSGLHLLGEGDIVICSENATFFDTHLDVGFVSQTLGLARRLPPWVVMRMVLMGSSERINAQKALQLGIVSEVVPLPRLIPRATEIAETICSKAPLAVWGSKEAFLRGLELPFETALELNFTLASRNRYTDDFKEGPRAFSEKRKPQWKAR